MAAGASCNIKSHSWWLLNSEVSLVTVSRDVWIGWTHRLVYLKKLHCFSLKVKQGRVCDQHFYILVDMSVSLYLHGVAEFRTAVAGVSHSVSVSVCLHRVWDLRTVIQNIWNA